VGNRRCVRLKTMSRNSCDVGTGWISFHVVFMASEAWLVAEDMVIGDLDTKKGIWEKFSIFFARPLVSNLIASRDLPHLEILACGPVDD
jgi:hypothetical protein